MSDRNITSLEVQILAGLSTLLEPEYVKPAEIEMWRGSPFQWIRTRPSRQVGAIGEALVAGWCAAKGFDVARSPDLQADRVVQGHRVEIKCSTLWTDNHIYKFQQIRDQEYEFCFCLGISPFDAHAWLIPKAVLRRNRPPALVPQHGGATGRDTKWLSFTAAAPPDWLRPYGGSLSSVADLIRAAGRGSARSH